MYPEGVPVYPEALSVYPEGVPVYPEALSMYPERNPMYPETITVYPAGVPLYPESYQWSESYVARLISCRVISTNGRDLNPRLASRATRFLGALEMTIKLRAGKSAFQATYPSS